MFSGGGIRKLVGVIAGGSQPSRCDEYQQRAHMTQDANDSDKKEVDDSDKKELDLSAEPTDTPIDDIKRFNIVRSEPIFALSPTGKKALTTSLVMGGLVFMLGALIALGTLTFRLSRLELGEGLRFPDGMDINSQAAVTLIELHP